MIVKQRFFSVYRNTKTLTFDLLMPKS